MGTALAPAFVAVFVGLGCWWGLPLVVSLLVLGLLVRSAALPMADAVAEPNAGSAGKTGPSGIPARFWVYAAFAVLYGGCETVNGTWATLYMKTHFGAAPATASLALTVFWGMVTAGRVLFALTEKWLPETLVCRLLPLVVTAALLTTAAAPAASPGLGLLTFALAGLGCSALLPLAISFAQRELTTIAASAAGGVVAFYQLGYGITAFGVGPLQTWAGWSLQTIYAGTALVGLATTALAWRIIRKPNPLT